jgi:phage terminase small subunit
MAKRGPKPKPTAIKILEGTRADRINELEPVYPLPDGVPAPPGWLHEYGVEHWRELAPLLHGQGILTQADLPAFANLCDLYSRWRRYEDDLSARKEYNRLLTEFGLTPSSRSRIRTPEKPKDALERFLSEGA